MDSFERFISWLVEPFVDILVEEKEEKYIDKSRIFRPLNFEEYIGQKNAKELLKNYITGIKQRNVVFPHTLIYGIAGCGKTTLARIIAKELNVNFISIIASDLEESEEIISKINETDGGILFVDEIHSLNREIAEKFYPLMEDFKNVKPFTLIGATTELGEILNNRKPFVDRFKIIIELENYSIEDLVKIICQYKNKVFANETIENETYKIIAENCRNTPRTAIRLIEATIYFNGNIARVLKCCNILQNGLTTKDLKVLEYIASNEKGVGLNSIAQYLDTSTQNYIYNIEPYLLQNNLITRTSRGRKITQRGYQTIKELNEIR